MIAGALRRALAPEPLSRAEVRHVFDTLLAGETTDLERAALLVALGARPTSVPELAECGAELRRRAIPFPVPRSDGAVDLCGSGGAGVPTFNVSTVGALVVAATGTPVVKHGNRSARGLCGSSDLLVALGLPVETSIEFARASYRSHRIAFLHAPLFHPATRAVAAARRALGVPTIFNRLGPLANPARVPFQVTGVAAPERAPETVRALAALGVRRALAVSSEEGADEFSPRRPTVGVEWTGRAVVRRSFEPSTYLRAEERRGRWESMPPAAAADETDRLLAGGGGARRGAVLLTAGAALWVARRAPSLEAGVDLARTALDDGRAEHLLADLRSLGARYGG